MKNEITDFRRQKIMIVYLTLAGFDGKAPERTQSWVCREWDVYTHTIVTTGDFLSSRSESKAFACVILFLASQKV